MIALPKAPYWSEGTSGPDRLLFPAITTGRLHLREPNMGDAQIFDEIFSDPSVRRYSNLPSILTASDVQVWAHWLCNAYRTSGACAWTIELRETGESIGSVRFNRIDADLHVAEVGFELLPRFRSNGYMAEALRAVIAHGELRFGLRRVEASCANENDASLKVLQKCGFRRSLGKQIFMGPNDNRKVFDLFELCLGPSLHT